MRHNFLLLSAVIKCCVPTQKLIPGPGQCLFLQSIKPMLVMLPERDALIIMDWECQHSFSPQPPPLPVTVRMCWGNKEVKWCECGAGDILTPHCRALATLRVMMIGGNRRNLDLDLWLCFMDNLFVFYYILRPVLQYRYHWTLDMLKSGLGKSFCCSNVSLAKVFFPQQQETSVEVYRISGHQIIRFWPWLCSANITLDM